MVGRPKLTQEQPPSERALLIREAIRDGRLEEPFNAGDVKRALGLTAKTKSIAGCFLNQKEGANSKYRKHYRKVQYGYVLLPWVHEWDGTKRSSGW